MFTVVIEQDGKEPAEIKISTRDIRRWEKENKGVSLANLDENSYADVYKLAYYAATRTGNFTGTLDEFENLVDLEHFQGAANLPTHQGASPETS
jgi:hypothetical protein